MDNPWTTRGKDIVAHGTPIVARGKPIVARGQWDPKFRTICIVLAQKGHLFTHGVMYEKCSVEITTINQTDHQQLFQTDMSRIS